MSPLRAPHRIGVGAKLGYKVEIRLGAGVV